MFKKLFVEASKKGQKLYYFEYNPEDYGRTYGETLDWIFDWNREYSYYNIETENTPENNDAYYVIMSNKKYLEKVAGWMNVRGVNIKEWK